MLHLTPIQGLLFRPEATRITFLSWISHSLITDWSPQDVPHPMSIENVPGKKFFFFFLLLEICRKATGSNLFGSASPWWFKSDNTNHREKRDLATEAHLWKLTQDIRKPLSQLPEGWTSFQSSDCDTDFPITCCSVTSPPRSSLLWSEAGLEAVLWPTLHNHFRY